MTQLMRPENALEALYRKIASTKPEPAKVSRETAATRMAKWQKSLTEMDQGELARLEGLLESFVAEKFAKVHVAEVRTLAQSEIDQMAAEYKDLQEIAAMVEARKADMKRMTFTHINVENKLAPEPEIVKGELVSEKEGLVFRREGGNPGEPDVNWEGLQATIDKETWEMVQNVEEVPEVVIPATTVKSPSVEKLLAAVELGKIDIETLRPFIIAGKPTPSKFVPRPLTSPRPK